MENKKFNFSEVTVRFHDVERSKLFSATFARCENKFASSKSAFIGYLAYLGLQEFLAELDGRKADEQDLSDYERISEAIDALIIYLRKEGECTTKKLSETLEIVSIILPLMLDFMDGKEVDAEEVLRGKYGDVPSKIKKKKHN